MIPNIKPALILLCGIPFAGKSTLAEKLKTDLGYKRIDLDEVKVELMGNSITDERITPQSWNDIYQRMYSQIRELLSRGVGVIHDTGNFTLAERESVHTIAVSIGLSFVTIFVNTPIATAKARMLENRKNKKRFDISDQAFELAVKEMAIPTSKENLIIFDEDTNYAKMIVLLQEKLHLPESF